MDTVTNLPPPLLLDRSLHARPPALAPSVDPLLRALRSTPPCAARRRLLRAPAFPLRPAGLRG
jgi:hypothetical protein